MEENSKNKLRKVTIALPVVAAAAAAAAAAATVY